MPAINKVHSKTAIKNGVTVLVFALYARNFACFFLVASEKFQTEAIVKNSHFVAHTMNLTKTLSPFFCLGFIFSVK